MSTQKSYLEIADSVLDFHGKDILEVGGCVLPIDIERYCPSQWTSIDINPRRLELLNELEIPTNYSYFRMDVSALEFQNSTFDIIYSINCFEHVANLRKAMSEMYRVLKPGGMLFTIFGPIWSSPVGHHTYIEDGSRIIHFNEGVIPDWQHLIFNKEELESTLLGAYEPLMAKRIVDYIYTSDDLNRLVDSDYLDIIKSIGFKKVIIFSRKKGNYRNSGIREMLKQKYPQIADPETTEFLFVLYKDYIPISRILRVYLGLVYQFVRQNILGIS